MIVNRRCVARSAVPSRLPSVRVAAYLGDGAKQTRRRVRVSDEASAKPKKATPWVFYLSMNFARVKKQLVETGAEASAPCVMRCAAAEWKSLSAEQRQEYVDAAEWRKLEIAEWEERRQASASALVPDVASASGLTSPSAPAVPQHTQASASTSGSMPPMDAPSSPWPAPGPLASEATQATTSEQPSTSAAAEHAGLVSPSELPAREEGFAREDAAWQAQTAPVAAPAAAGTSPYSWPSSDLWGKM